MALVDYGSDSDSDTAPSLPTAQLPLPIKAPAAVPIASTSSLALPPPKSTTSKRTKTKGPLRIMLDLPPPSTSTSTSSTTDEEVEPARKKPKFTISSGGGGGGGLAAMLPAPKNDVTLLLDKALGKTVEQGSDTAEGSGVEERVAGEGKESGEGRTFSTGFVPYSLSKGKRAAAAIVPIEPVIDFFGLGSTTTTSLPSSSSFSPTASTSYLKKSSITISSAPSLPIANPTTTSSYGDTPTPTDPYPGFILLPSGQWVAKDQLTYDAWVSSLDTQTKTQEEQDRPKGFGESDVLRNGGGFVEVDDRARNEERERMVGQAKVRPGREEMEKPVLKTAAKLGGGRAKSRHQLSTLLADAIENRADLEERIAQAKSARKGSGAKYGF